MKKQINSVSIWSVKSGLSVTVLCALLGATEVNANNFSTAALNSGSKMIKTEVKDENVMNRNSTPWVVKNNDQKVKEQITAVMTQWMSDSSYWSSDDSLVNDRKMSGNREKVLKSNQCPGILPVENESVIINAKSYIANLKF